MSDETPTSYTAKLTDGPLEGKTLRTEFTEAGDPVARIEIPAGPNKRYLYARGRGQEFGADGGTNEQPSAVDYRFLEAVVA